MLTQEFKQYSDKYFLRAGEILRAYDYNPKVLAQVFIRKGPGTVWGVDEVVKLFDEHTDLKQNGGSIMGLQDLDSYDSCETIMLIEGRIQDIIEWETICLGLLSSYTTRETDELGVGYEEELEENMRKIVIASENRSVSYFGARHWHYGTDKTIAKAAFKGGAKSCSTDSGASNIGQKGVGTIPHSLEVIFHWKHGLGNAVLESTRAFDHTIDRAIPRTALIDYANLEITDTIRTAKNIKSLYTIRIDTCGENTMEGVQAFLQTVDGRALAAKLSNTPGIDSKYVSGRGVSILGTYLVRKALDTAGLEDVGVMLSSGFGNLTKVQSFVRAEKILELPLFDSLGVGGIFQSRAATMDIVMVEGKPISKVGRSFKPSKRLQKLL